MKYLLIFMMVLLLFFELIYSLLHRAWRDEVTARLERIECAMGIEYGVMKFTEESQNE